MAEKPCCPCLARQVGFLIPLDQVTPAHRPLVGAKAVNLAQMLRAGLPVPPGFCLTARAYDRFVESSDNLPSAIASIATVDPSALNALRLASENLLAQFLQTDIPPELTNPIASALQNFDPNTPFAVRSSALAEDLPDASFAGQHDTLLNVCGLDNILTAIRRCFASLFTPRALTYRHRKHIDPRRASMAVIVQQMVPADLSGVLFTADPLTGNPDRIVIESAPGLGEALVSGHADPERTTLEKSTLTILDRSPTSHLSRDLAQQLATLAKKVEPLFSHPQDIEFAIAAGQIHLLQSRPITTLPQNTQKLPDVWSNANTGELLPEVATPMTFAILQLLLEGILNPILRAIGIEVDQRRWFDLFAGRVYMNVTITAELMHSLPVPGKINVTEAFGGQQHKLPPHVVESLLTGKRTLKLRTILRAPAMGFWFLTQSTDRAAARFLDEWRRRIDAVASLDPANMPDDALANCIHNFLAASCQDAKDPSFAGSAIGTMGLGMGCAMALPGLTQRWLNDADGSIAARLLAGAGEMASAQAGLDLWRLATWVKDHPSIHQLIQSGAAFAQLAQTLPSSPDGAEFLHLWQAFITNHGHHTRGEVDVHIPRWSETPDYLLDMLRNYLRLDNDPIEQQSQRLRDRQNLLTDCNKRLRNPLKRFIFGFLVRKAQRGIAQRENIKSQAIRLIAAIRRALLEAGQRLATRKILADPDDIFFLKPEELPPVFAGSASFDVPVTIASRRAEFTRNQSLTPPTVIFGPYDPDTFIPDADPATATILHGVRVSPGVVTGRARVILHADANDRVLPGEILVAPFTDPGWVPYFLTAAALVTDLGGQLSHGSIVAREYGIPAVVNTHHATQSIHTGDLITVDGHQGTVTLHSQNCRTDL